jgi:hypothetical protein
MATRFNKLRIRNTFSYVNVYYAATVDELNGITGVEDNAYGLVGPEGSEIPYVYIDGAWTLPTGSSLSQAVVLKMVSLRG